MSTRARALPTSVTAFAEELFTTLPRADQRRWARTYLHGLLVTHGKKSLRRIAATITASQAMHQLINASPWDWEPIRDELAGWTSRLLVSEAYVIDLAFIRKRGDHSCSIHNRFIPPLGQSVNCQVGMGVFLATSQEAVPVDWRLHLPPRWLAEKDQLRAKIPGQSRAQGFDEQALDLITALDRRIWAAPLPVVTDLSAHGDSTTLLQGLVWHGRHFVVAVPAHPRFKTSQGLECKARSVTIGQPIGMHASTYAAHGQLEHGASSALLHVPDDLARGDTWPRLADLRSVARPKPDSPLVVHNPVRCAHGLPAVHDPAPRPLSRGGRRAAGELRACRFRGRVLPPLASPHDHHVRSLRMASTTASAVWT